MKYRKILSLALAGLMILCAACNSQQQSPSSTPAQIPCSYRDRVMTMYRSLSSGNGSELINCWPDEIYSLCEQDGRTDLSKRNYESYLQDRVDQIIKIAEDATGVPWRNWKITYKIDRVNKIYSEAVPDILDDTWGDYYEYFWRDVTDAVEIVVDVECWVSGSDTQEDTIWLNAIEWNSSWYILNYDEMFGVIEKMIF